MREYIEKAVTRYAFGDRGVIATLVTGLAAAVLVMADQMRRSGF